MRWLGLFLLFLLIAAQHELWSAYGGIPNVLSLQQQIAMQVQQNAELYERNQALDAEVRDLKNGLEAVEERARSEMGMIKAGEVYFQIVDASALPGAVISSKQLTADAQH